jgi:hypothetical protein
MYFWKQIHAYSEPYFAAEHWKLWWFPNIYLWRKVVCLFCVSIRLRCLKPWHLLLQSCTIGKPLTSTSAWRWFPNVSIYSGEIIEHNIFIEISFQSKLKFIEKFEHTIDNIVGKPLMGKI